VFYPAVGVNEDGEGAIVFSVSGPDYFPSAGYVHVSDDGTGPVHIAALGVAPEDGFSGYAAFGGNGHARWGDYSAAVADGEGNIWIATEFIPNRPRTLLADWGTFVGKVPLDEE
jgi:hypothetical protein